MWHLGTLTSSGLLNLTWWSCFLFNIQCRRRRPVVAFYVFCASFQHIFYTPFLFPFSVFHSISFPFSMFFFISVFLNFFPLLFPIFYFIFFPSNFSSGYRIFLFSFTFSRIFYFSALSVTS